MHEHTVGVKEEDPLEDTLKQDIKQPDEEHPALNNQVPFFLLSESCSHKLTLSYISSPFL